MRWLIRLFVLALLSAPTSQILAQDWADLQITFIYDGKPPERKPIDMGKDEWCAKNGAGGLDEKMVVNSKNQGIQNMGLWVDKKKSKLKDDMIHPDLAKVPDTKPILDNNKCIFLPHFLVVRSGQTIEVKNSDGTGHNANFNFVENPPQNFVVPPNSSKDLALAKGVEEPAPIPVQCNIHPWMEAKVMVVDHPYGAVSDENGQLKIEKLPAGKKLTFRLFHENAKKGGIDKLEIDGKSAEWAKGFVEMELKPGKTELKIKLAPAMFK